MMSKKKWTLMLIIFVLYLLLGASFFYKIESEHEQRERDEARIERIEILKLLKIHYKPSYLLEDFLDKLGTYCGKNLINVTDDYYDEPPKWDFYHSVFFSFTVVTTVGYGNLAPTTTTSRMFMIFYGLVGIPYNGILFATLGEYFGRTFTKLYKRWKTRASTRKNSETKMGKPDLAKLGLVGQIILYLIPGFTIFIFVPAVAFMIFEDWEYDLAVYYAFVTLTTIGFGDYVAGMNRYNHGFGIYFFIYQICILVWMTIGLGYLVMVIGFLTRGLRSKKVRQLEKIVKQNIKNTQAKIWNGFSKDFIYLRRLMNELYMAKFKGTVNCQIITEISPVYRDESYVSTSTIKIGSQSFPDLRILYPQDSPRTLLRRRAMSESHHTLVRAQSDSDLSRIDRDATFAAANSIQPSELLAKVVDALSHTEEMVEESDHDEFEELGVQGFSDSEILKSEMFGSGWSIGSKSAGGISVEKVANPPRVPRMRAASDVKIPEKIRTENIDSDWTWSGPAATKKIEELRARTKFNRPRMRTKSDETTVSGKSWLEKFRNSFRRKHAELEERKTETERQEYLQRTAGGRKSTFSIPEERYLHRTKSGRASVFSVPESRVLEETTVADLLRALTSLHSRVGSIPELVPEPHRKYGLAGITSKVPSSLDLFNPPTSTRMQMRRTSMTPNALTRRRFSLHPVQESELPPPPPYSPNLSLPTQLRQGSILPTITPAAPGLVHKQVSRLRGTQGSETPFRRTRHDSLRDIRIDKL